MKFLRLLRILAGLEVPERGQVWFGERDVSKDEPASRGIGFVFQNYALFGHMTAAQNIAFGLDVMKRSARPSRNAIGSASMSCSSLFSWPVSANAIQASYRAASGSGWRLPARSRGTRAFCFSMSRSARSTQKSGASCAKP